MYKIGEFSKIVNIPVRTLRYYDQEGILKPSVIDKYTGYRFYDKQNILEIEYIKLLKSVNFTLDEITNNKNNINENILKNKQFEIQNKIQNLEKQYQKLTLMQKELKKNNNKGKVLSLIKINEDNQKEEDYE